MKRNRTILILLAAVGGGLTLGPVPRVPAQSGLVTSAARLSVPLTTVDTSCGSLTLGGTVNLLTQVTIPTDPCQALVRVHGAGVLPAAGSSGRRYYAILQPSWTQKSACLGGAAVPIPLLFHVQPAGVPLIPVDP